jgi:hypothetical protein
MPSLSAAPHPPGGTFSPYSDGEKELAPSPAPLSPFFTGVRGTGETSGSPRMGKGEGRRRFPSLGMTVDEGGN